MGHPNFCIWIYRNYYARPFFESFTKKFAPTNTDVISNITKQGNLNIPNSFVMFYGIFFAVGNFYIYILFCKAKMVGFWCFSILYFCQTLLSRGPEKHFLKHKTSSSAPLCETKIFYHFKEHQQNQQHLPFLKYQQNQPNLPFSRTSAKSAILSIFKDISKIIKLNKAVKFTI